MWPFKKKLKVKHAYSLTNLDDAQRSYLIKSYEAYLKSCKENKRYSNQRLDYLLVAVSASGIISLFTVAKEMKLNNTSFLFLCAGLFVLCIILNLISQFVALRSNEREIAITKEKLMDLEFKVFSETKYESAENSINNLDSWIVLLNRLCLISSISGVILSVTFLAVEIL